MDEDPVRVLLIESGRIPFDPVVAALERLRPATEHRFSSRLLGCHQLGPGGLAVVTDHHRLGSLERVVVRSGPGSEAEALLMAAEIGEAVMHCHGAGFVHGHVGPGTVMLGDDGHPRLAAHGALGELEAGLGARPTPPGIVPPEGRPSAAGDVFAIGLIAVYAATGMLDPRAMPKRWAPLVGPALDADPARRPTDLRMFVAGLRSVADALMAGAKVAVVEVPGGTSAMTGASLAAAATTAATAPGGPQAIVDGLQLNKVPRRRGRRMTTLGSVAALAATGVAAAAIYAATSDDHPPSTTVSVGSVVPSVATVPATVGANAPTTVASVTTAATVPSTTATVVTTATTVPSTAATVPAVSTLPPSSAPIATSAVTTPDTTVAPTTRRTATTRGTTTRATSPSTKTSPPTSSPGATTASTLPPDVERGKD